MILVILQALIDDLNLTLDHDQILCLNFVSIMVENEIRLEYNPENCFNPIPDILGLCWNYFQFSDQEAKLL